MHPLSKYQQGLFYRHEQAYFKIYAKRHILIIAIKTMPDKD